jgi:hypothetical protein
VTCLRFELANRLNCLYGGHCSTGLSDRLRGYGIPQAIADEPLLPCELMADQFPDNAQGCPGFRCKGLGAPEPGIGRADWSCCRKYAATPVKHYETRILVSQPAERGERYHSVSADYD